jgi:hypothetical protein
MSEASRDQNRVTTLLAVSNVDGLTPVTLYADPVTHRLLVDAATSGGTVTSVASADGSITVTNPTTTVDLSVVKSPKLTTARTIAMSGDVTWSVNFDGSGNVTAAGTLATVNANVGSFGSATQTGTFTVNAKGLITAAANVTITPAASSITGGAALTKTDDTNVTLTLGGTPTTALLAAASITVGWTGQLGLTRGGTAASLTASNGGIVYSTGSALSILAGTATAGQILRSGASTTPSWSTATYPATAGASGNVLTSDGTNFVSTAPTSSSTPTTMISTTFETAGRFDVATKGGTGGASFNTQGVYLQTSTTASSYQKIKWKITNSANAKLFLGSPVFGTDLMMNDVNEGSGTGVTYVGIGDVTVDGTSHIFTDAHAGFKLVKTGGVISVYATQGDGATETVSSALTTVTNQTYIELIMKINSTTSIDYYWRKNGGSLSSATNLTANMPTGTDTNIIQFSTTNQGTAFDYNMYIGGANYSR